MKADCAPGFGRIRRLRVRLVLFKRRLVCRVIQVLVIVAGAFVGTALAISQRLIDHNIEG
jgi:hypothetical protein